MMQSFWQWCKDYADANFWKGVIRCTDLTVHTDCMNLLYDKHSTQKNEVTEIVYSDTLFLLELL